MGIFYNVSNKQLLKDLISLFKEVGIPSLEKNNFVPSQFTTSWTGQYNRSTRGYSYQFDRLKSKKYLERIDIDIYSGKKNIQMNLNIFELSPELESISELNKYESINFGIPPNSSTVMQLRCSQYYKGPPLFYMLFLPEHKIGSYYTKSGYEKEIAKLQKLIKFDMENIDIFVKRWHEIHKPNLTDWEGNVLTNTTRQMGNVSSLV